ncbi:MAG: glycerophosphoryl diester phosphodiesterase [Acidimicrobiales bacterium]|nr:MAG: glycerophosphoryl diester phosphodiesterase [Acidimicrobiales bacterium]
MVPVATFAPLRDPPVLFAHRGGCAHRPENTLEAFSNAVAMGATGIESDVWLTADRVPVLTHDGVIRRGLRRVPINRLRRRELPSEIPSLEDLYRTCGTEVEVSLDVKDPDAVEAVLDTVRSAGPDAEGRLWLCHGDVQVLGSWRELTQEAKLVNSTRLRRIDEGVERRAADLARLGIDAINMHATDWTAGTVVLFHRFRRLALAWDAQLDRVIEEMLRAGVDAVYGDHVDRLTGALLRVRGQSRPI